MSRLSLAWLWITVSLAIASCGQPMVADGGTDARSEASMNDIARTDTPNDGVAACATDMDCTDSVYCNGVEHCMPGAPGADARGCVAASPATPCMTGQTCNEAMMRCDTTCAMGGDADGDGRRAMNCGGDDCDDADPNRFVGNTELCDPAGHDEDCDPSTFGFRDSDMDSYADARCCNSTPTGMNCGDDCNDSRPNVHPSLVEACDGLDNNCDGTIDEGVLVTYRVDGDGDGFADPMGATMTACSQPPGYAQMATDCNDSVAAVHPGAAEVCDAAMLDEDCDGMANPPSLCDCSGTGSRPCTLMGVCSAGVERCVSGSWGACSIAPVPEACNSLDDDCNGVVDDGVSITCYPDSDNDGYPASGATSMQVCPVSGRDFVGGCPSNQTNRAPMGSSIDCNDGDSTVSPGAIELCDASMVDENCDGAANPMTLCMCSGTVMRACPLPGACAAGMQTCTLGSWSACSISPITESCNRVDDDCDGMVDEGLTVVCYADDDNDTYSATGSVAMNVCPVTGRTTVGGCPTNLTNRAPTGAADCSPTNAAINPGQIELCDPGMLDENCSGTANEGCSCTTGASRSCPQPGACARGTQSCTSGVWGTCSITPTTEACNGVDDDCDGVVDEGLTATCYADLDNDTYAPAGAMSSQQCIASGRTAVGGCPDSYTNRAPTTGNADCADTDALRNPMGAERCNRIDDDCDGMIDEGLTVTCYADNDGDTYAAAGAASSAQCPDTTRPSVGGCPVGLTNRAPTAGQIDCADSNSMANPSITETCNGVDDNCNGTVDEGLRVTCYPDSDGDTYAPTGSTSMTYCPVGGRTGVGGCPSGFTNRVPSAGAADCNDSNALINPAAAEQCDAARIDENCDGVANPTTLCACSGTTSRACPLPGACAAGTQTCSSGMWGACSIAPTTEICDNVDNDCDGMTDESLRVTCYADADDDGYAPSGTAAMTPVCPVAGRAAVGGCPVNTTNRAPTSGNIDCADADPTRRPSATDVCDGIDNNCNGTVDEPASADASCTAPNAYNACRAGVCTILSCYDLRGDCDGDPATGCETDLGGPANCGQCGLSCGVAGSCYSGRCDGITGIQTSGQHTCVWRGDGLSLCFGANTSGQLGNGTTTSTPFPVAPAPALNGIVDMGTGNGFTCARRTTGAGVFEVWCWGANAQGQLGNGTMTLSNVPVRLTSLPTTVQQLTVGTGHACVRLSDSTIRCWGLNDYGQLGIGNITNQTLPQTVPGITTAVDVVAGGSHTCARLSSGLIRCWGRNASGQLGNGSTVDSSSPVTVTGLINVNSLALGGSHTCARQTGRIYCWGENSNGQVGDETLVDRTTPTLVHAGPGTTTPFNLATDLTAGLNHTCAIDNETTLGYPRISCWGQNNVGQLGDGTTTQSSLPRFHTGVIDAADIRASSAGSTTCVRRATGQMACWGANGNGQVGNNSASTSVPSETTVLNFLPATIRSIGGGLAYGCVLLPTGTVMCWGDNGSGQLGDGTTTERPYPALVSINDVLQLSVGSYTACARIRSGQVRCWGDNGNGQLGNGTTVNSPTPVLVTGISTAVEVDVGDTFACARLASGQVTCWGSDSNGQLGDGVMGATRTAPTTTVPTIGSAAGDLGIAVDLGVGTSHHACARLHNGSVACWGDNAVGEVGNGSTTTGIFPPGLVASVNNAVELDSGSDTSCVRRTTGAVGCWGAGSFGQIGDGTGMLRRTISPVSGVTAADQISVQGSTNCARSGGSIRCWGNNANGQVGDGSTANRFTSAPVPGTTWIGLGRGMNFSCALEPTTAMPLPVSGMCWGANNFGMLGNGTTGPNVLVPSPVIGLP